MEKDLARIYELKNVIKRANEEIEDLYASIPQSQEVGTYVGENFGLKVSPNKSFDVRTAQRVLAPELYAKILEPKPSTQLAKKFLSGDQYESCQAVRGVKREVVAYDDE